MSRGGAQRLDEAISLGTPLLASDPRDQKLAGRLASCHDQLANLLRDDGKLAEAEPHYQDAISFRRDAGRVPTELPEPLADLGEGLIDQATYFRNRADLYGDARKLYLDALGILKKLQTEDPQNSRYMRDEAVTMNNLGWLELRKKTGHMRPSKETGRRGTGPKQIRGRDPLVRSTRSRPWPLAEDRAGESEMLSKPLSMRTPA